MSLRTLEEQVRKDPKAYVDEFTLQYFHLKNSLEVFKLKPSDEAKGLSSSIQFVCSVCGYYKDIAKDLPQLFIQILDQYQQSLHPNVRKQIVNGLISLRNHELVDAKTVLPCLFKLFRVHDKALRKLVYSHIIGDIIRINQKSKNTAVNRGLQNYMYSMLKDTNRIAAHKSLEVMINLYRKKIWDDERTVNVISSGCFSQDTKIVVTALKFFLGSNDEEEDENEENIKDQEIDRQVLIREIKAKFSNLRSKKTKKKKNQYEKALKKASKSVKLKEKHQYIESLQTVHLLNDPQTFAERLFGKLKSTNEKFEIRIMMMDVISRCIAAHKLIILNFYAFAQKYMEPRHPNVTRILAITAQAVHELVPDDAIYPAVMSIANNFVNDRSSPESIIVGLNTIREICSRQPLVMKKTLLRDLAQYAKAKNKMVFHAARGIIQLYRRLNPKMLSKKDRGKDHSKFANIKEYGHTSVSSGLDGIELLEKIKNGELSHDLDSDSDQDDEKIDESGQWIKIENSDDDDDDELNDEELEETLQEIMNSDDDDDDDDNDDNDNDDNDNDDKEENKIENTNEFDDVIDSEDEQETDENGQDIDDDDENDNNDDDDNDNNDDEDDNDDDNNDDDDDDDDDNDGEISENNDKNDRNKTNQVTRKKRKSKDDDDDDDNDGDEMDSEDEQELLKLKQKEEQKKKEIAMLSASKILTQEDFELLKKARLMAEAESATSSILGKRKTILNPEELEEDAKAGKRKRRNEVDDKDGTDEDDEEKGWKFRSKKHGLGTTNKGKKKTKNFMMIKNSRAVRSKNVMSQKSRTNRQKASMKKKLKFKLKHH